jgi:hypothetical protein
MTCLLCGERSDDVLNHLRLWHDHDEPLETWPDGGLVVVDLTDLEELT